MLIIYFNSFNHFKKIEFSNLLFNQIIKRKILILTLTTNNLFFKDIN